MKNVLFAVIAIAVSAAIGGFLLLGEDEPVQNVTGVLPGTLRPAMAAVAAVSKESSEERPQPSKSGPWPKAVVDKTEFGFGRMTVGSKQDHAFTIRNDGEADLVLLAGQPTCKCTVFDLSSTTVKPGESADLMVEWHGKLKDANFQHGGSVYTNDPQLDEIRFVVKGIVDASIDVLPNDTWSVGEVTESAPGIMEAVVLSRVHDEFSVSGIECDSPFIQTTVVPMPPDRLGEYKALRAYLVTVTVSSDMPPGVLEEELKLMADCIESPISLKVTAHKLGPIRILPTPGVIWVESNSRLLFGQFSTNTGREVALTLLVDEPEGTEPLQFTSVEADPSFIAVELVPGGRIGGGKSRYTMKVSIPSGIPRSDRAADHPAHIRIETNHPTGQSMDINLTYKAF